MTYAINQLIRAADYNSFAGSDGTDPYNAEPAGPSLAQGGSLGIMYGPGYGSYGYNQSNISLSAVNIGDLIRTGEWTDLRNILAAIRTHQTGSVDATVPPTSVLVEDHLIEAHESSSPSNDPYDFNSIIDLALTNRFAMAAGTLFSLSTVTRATSWGSGSGNIQCVLRTVWANADAAGFFFNTGGYIRFNFTQPVSTSQDSDWSDAFTTRIGVIRVGATTTVNTGSVVINSGLGYYDLTGSYQTIWLGTGANGFVQSAYSSNTVQIEALVTGTPVNGRPGEQIDFRITLNENHTGSIDIVSSGTEVAMAAVKDTTNLTTVPATPTPTTVTPW